VLVQRGMTDCCPSSFERNVRAWVGLRSPECRQWGTYLVNVLSVQRLEIKQKDWTVNVNLRNVKYLERGGKILGK
jgi:hypothetical protein